MPRATTLEALADLAEEQWGLFTRRQAEATGMAWTTLARLAERGLVVRVAHGVYRLRGSVPDNYLELRAAWIQLAPGTPVWERTADQGVVSHRSAAAMYGLGDLPADEHHFSLPTRRQTRRPDVRLHRARLEVVDSADMRGLLVTRPARTAADLLGELEDPTAVAHVIADALRGLHERPERMAEVIAHHAARLGFERGDGMALLQWLLDLAGAPELGRQP